MIEEFVHFYADGLKLEGVLTYNEDASSSPAILLCSPHPNLGGNMDNNVLMGLVRVSASMGFITLRFNYRGVGNSESHEKDIAQIFQYWDVSLHGGDYNDAVTDTRAALHFLVSQSDTTMIFIAGYSFGAVVGMRVGVEDKKVKAFASVSTPFGRYNMDFLHPCTKSKLFLYSQNDFATTPEDTEREFAMTSPPKTLEFIENSDHFYRGQEDIVSQKVCAFFDCFKRHAHTHKDIV